MQYLYNGSAEELPVQARDILELMAAANFFQVLLNLNFNSILIFSFLFILVFSILMLNHAPPTLHPQQFILSPHSHAPQLDGLLHFCEVRCASLIDLDTIVSYYIHAKVEEIDMKRREGGKRGEDYLSGSRQEGSDRDTL